MTLLGLLSRLTALAHVGLALGAGLLALRTALGLVAVPAASRAGVAAMLALPITLMLASVVGLLLLARRVWRDPAGARGLLLGVHAPLLGLGVLMIAYGRSAQAAAARSAADGGGLMGGFGDLVLLGGLALTLVAGCAVACAVAAGRSSRPHQSVGL